MVIIALGGNMSSLLGPPIHTMKWAIGQMTNDHIHVISCSPFYCTKPVGRDGQQDYINAVVRVQTSLSAASIFLKISNRSKKQRDEYQPKCEFAAIGDLVRLDLDLVDYKGLVSTNLPVCNGELTLVKSVGKMRQCRLVLPHPQAHLRPFVIRPLLDIEPLWHHPVSGLSASSLWALLRFSPDGQILAQAQLTHRFVNNKGWGMPKIFV